MANINDFKLLNIKCKAYFALLEKEISTPFKLPSDEHKEKFGFYLFMIEKLCNIKDISDVLDLITDTEFNSILFEIKDEDFGVDAVFIDEDSMSINLFNFKFRNKYNPDKQQSINETIISTKFVNAIKSENTDGLKGKLKNFADEIIQKLASNELWKFRLYMVSNENELDVSSSPEINLLKDVYGLETIAIGLDAISKMMSIRPSIVNAVVVVNVDSILPYSESSLSSSKSYVIKISANDLIRITCNKPEYRNKYDMEDFSVLFNTEMEYSLLFDNVRGLVERSTFNDKILDTLREEPSRFFMYNNGLTMTAKNIEPREENAKKKIVIEITDFQVVNGGQTLRTLHKFNQQDKDNVIKYLSNCELLIRVFKTTAESEVRNKIAEFTNSQNAISKIDLKSLSFEQIQIEQFLDQHNIIYARKTGDTGIAPLKNYVHKISMEKFGQILFSVQGKPEKASNQKKQIFDKYYKEIFIEKFDMLKSVQYINRYHEIKKEYEGLAEFKSVTDQKIFYILYIDTKLDVETRKKIIFFEDVLKNYIPSDGKPVPEARKLIQIDFKQKLDQNIEDFLSNNIQ